MHPRNELEPEPEHEPQPDPESTPPPEPEPDSTPEPEPEPTPKPRRRFGCTRLLLAALALVVLYALFQWITWPDVEALAADNPESTAFIERAQRRGVDVDQRWVSYGAISPHLKRAVLASEDMSFFDHDGFDDAEIEKALSEAWEEKRLPRGASTLTQQLAKNLWLTPSYNPWRKVKEAMLTRQLEEHLEKRRIFELYLNVAQFGPDVYGAEAAARRYYGVPASALSEEQAARLAAGLPRPSSWHPGVQSGSYDWKTNLVLGRMRKAGWLWKVI